MHPTRRTLLLLTLSCMLLLLKIVAGAVSPSNVLLADGLRSFNAIFSHLLALWAESTASKKIVSKQYTYGWGRIEYVVALVNSVAIIGFCIVAIFKFVSTQITPESTLFRPHLMIILAAFGLTINALGHVLMGAPSLAEAENRHLESSSFAERTEAERPIAHLSPSTNATNRSAQAVQASSDKTSIHPSSFRASIMEAARLERDKGRRYEDEQSPLLLPSPRPDQSQRYGTHLHQRHRHQPPSPPESTRRRSPMDFAPLSLWDKFDALSNLLMIFTATLILKAHGPWIARVDQGLATMITLYMLVVAVSLCKQVSRVLLQGTPAGMSLDEIREDIEGLAGVMSCHHLHIWQLDDTKIIATLHVQMEYRGLRTHVTYADLAREVREYLYEYGIYPSTIEPEFVSNSDSRNSSRETNITDSCRAQKVMHIIQFLPRDTK